MKNRVLTRQPSAHGRTGDVLDEEQAQAAREEDVFSKEVHLIPYNSRRMPASRKFPGDLRRVLNSRSQASSGRTCCARSARFLATIRARMSGTVSIKGVDPMVSETLSGNGEARLRGCLTVLGRRRTGSLSR